MNRQAGEAAATMPETARPALLDAVALSKVYLTPKGRLPAFADVNCTVDKNKSLGIVGETGSGKSTLVRVLQLLERPTSGVVRFRGIDVTWLSEGRLRPLRRNMQFVAQDPYSSLFPNLTVAQNIVEPLHIHQIGNKAERFDRVIELMTLVGLPAEIYHSFPHELSGGQQQRVAIARALALEPEILILDEAVSSLDVSIQAQILNLMQRLKRELGITYVFISHNLAVVRLLCEEVAVMYLGRIVEKGEADAVFRNPAHPYTRSLVVSIPAFRSEGVTPLPDISQLRGERLSPTNLPPGCAFQTRCPLVSDSCRRGDGPELREISPGRQVACFQAELLDR